jgi:ATP-binding cassette subfamily B protein/subfamily B ATP-binding cassette protein MsbA
VFVEQYKARKLDEALESKPGTSPADDGAGKAPSDKKAKRRQHLRGYVRWLRPHRGAIAVVFLLALAGAGIDVIQPLFSRYIIDRVLLERGLDSAARVLRLQLAGGVFLAVVVVSSLVGVAKDYRQRILNVKVTLTLRRTLYQRLLHLPLPRLWDMKTGGILSRLTGDVETTTGLLQLAVISPAIAVIRLGVAVGVLLALNWRLALAALALVPGVMVVSFIFARRVRPIYRSVRKDAEEIDGRVGETFSGIRVVRAFRQELGELLEYMRG